MRFTDVLLLSALSTSSITRAAEAGIVGEPDTLAELKSPVIRSNTAPNTTDFTFNFFQPYAPVIPLKDTTLSSADSAALQNVLVSCNIFFSVATPGSERHSLNPQYDYWIRDLRTPKFDQNLVERMAGKPVLILGQVERFEIRLAVEENAHDLENNFLKGDGANASYQDKFGNIVRLCSYRSSAVSSKANRALIISPPVHFESTTGDSSGIMPLNLDLSKLGLPDLRGYFYTRSEPVREIRKGYRIYSDVPDLKLSDSENRRLDDFLSGASRAETYFGYAANEIVHSLYIVNGSRPNAETGALNPGVVTLTRGTLLAKQPCQFQGFHEAVHAIDLRSDWSLSSGRFSDLHKELLASDSLFLSTINESKSLLGVKDAGHVEDHARELLPSLLNAITSSNFANIANNLSKKHRAHYIDLLSALRENLHSLPEISPTAPIDEILKQKIEFLRRPR